MVNKKMMCYRGCVVLRWVRITICPLFASLVVPNRDPKDGYFYPTQTLMIDSYNIHAPIITFLLVRGEIALVKTM